MTTHFCTSCGRRRGTDERFCAACGTAHTSISIGTSPDPFRHPPSVVIPDSATSKHGNQLRSVLWLLAATFASQVLLVLAFVGSDYNNAVSNFTGHSWVEMLLVGSLIPGILTLAPFLQFKLQGSNVQIDMRLVLVGVTSAFLIGLRSLDALFGHIDDSPIVVLAGIIGLSGFAAFPTVIRWNTVLRASLRRPDNPLFPIIGITAAVVFLWARYSSLNGSFIFSPASQSGRSPVEFVFLALLVVTGFMASPFRQPLALALGGFSIASFMANSLVSDIPLVPWPNPFTFVCCLIMLHPFNEVVSGTVATFSTESN